MPSLGDLLVDVLLLLFLAAYAHRVMRAVPSPQRWRIAISVSVLTLIGFAAWINDTLIGLVYDSSVDLDLFHLQSFDRYSVTALIAVALLLAAWSVLADGLVWWLGVKASLRDLALFSAIAFACSLLVHHLAHVYDTVLVLWPLPVLIVLVAARRHTRAHGPWPAADRPALRLCRTPLQPPHTEAGGTRPLCAG
ncbi:MAG: hypothetical protein IPN38_13610 [Flavobacteriales bacterium]|nr:hypothetical protein [Flavobacteriales bacterium]